MISPIDGLYAGIIRLCLDSQPIPTRNGNCYRSITVPMVEIHTTPLLLSRRVAYKTCLREWEWFMSGSSDIEDLHESVRPWWQPFANQQGWLFYNYGWQFREFSGSMLTVDQIDILLKSLTSDPYSRRHVITTWNTADMQSAMCRLPNCHGTVIQAFVNPDKTLHLKTYQRSCDAICGLPHNWFQYWAFLLWLAARTSLIPGSLSWIGGDVHIYEAHADLARKIVTTCDGSPLPDGPTLVYTPSGDTFKADDFALTSDYNPILTDKAEMIV